MPRKRKSLVSQSQHDEVEVLSVPVSGEEEVTKKVKQTNASERESACENGEVFIENALETLEEKTSPKSASPRKRGRNNGNGDDDVLDSRFIGKPFPLEEATGQWPKRYQWQNSKSKKPAPSMGKNEDGDEIKQARNHFTQAEVDGSMIFDLYDDAYVKGNEGEGDFICKIIEMFEGIDGELYFTAQWYYRAKDTVIEKHGHLIDNKRVFFSEIKDDNPLGCLVKKLKIARIPLNADSTTKMAAIVDCDYYSDMMYLLPYSTFIKFPPDCDGLVSDSSSTISIDVPNEIRSDSDEECQAEARQKREMFLLDLYAGCGAMSTGLCLGAKLSSCNLVTKWAVDINTYACETLKLNHPETEVRNESAEDFLSLLKEWEKLCIFYNLISGDLHENYFHFESNDDNEDDEDNDEEGNNNDDDGEVFEVETVLAICWGDPNQKREKGLYFKVSWKGYDASYDTWEPIDGLSNCRESIGVFVNSGYKRKILPLPGDVDVICGGPPCQGVSGFNRFRNAETPLDDPKNQQLVVFMDFVKYLKPKYVLMENVVDLLKFAGGYLGRYALGRLVEMNYQTRMGIMAAGCYGLPQFRMRVFLWGALPTEKLPQYPLPTHDVVQRGAAPVEFERNNVAYEEFHKVKMEDKLLLADAISDLPHVTNDEERDEMPYGQAPQSDFQRFIRLGKDGSELDPSSEVLFDHRPLKLNTDDYQRVCQIPKKKGANFRDLPGVLAGLDNKVYFDPNMERVLLPSGKPLVPDYAMSFVRGSSSKPFGRLWWDETVPTVVTRAEPHNQIILHPEQDRVLSIRENARLQGFPDYYKLLGPLKERYIQVGNAVAVPVSRALGYSLGLACRGSVTDAPLFTLPTKFPSIIDSSSPSLSDENVQ